MVSERPARSRKSAPGTLEPESNDFARKKLDEEIDGLLDPENLLLELWRQKSIILKRIR